MKIVQKIRAAYRFLQIWAGPVVLSLTLLFIRVVWGWAFFLAGKGKLSDISRPIAFFQELHIPFPTANAWLVACVECFGGLLLLVGLATRPVALMLTVNMIVAYLTADHEAVAALFTDSDATKFIGAAPFWFLVTSLICLALGPGMISLDAIGSRLFGRSKRESFVA